MARKSATVAHKRTTLSTLMGRLRPTAQAGSNHYFLVKSSPLSYKNLVLSFLYNLGLGFWRSDPARLCQRKKFTKFFNKPIMTFLKGLVKYQISVKALL